MWIALADLYLDTDVRLSYAYILRALFDSPYSIEELRAILDNEVAPVVEGNLLSVAGEWGAFDEEWLVSKAAARLGKKRWTPSLVDIGEDWDVLSGLLRRLRVLPPEEARRRLAAWTTLLPLILNRTAAIQEPAPGEPPAEELERIFREELLPVLLPQAVEFARKSPEVYPSRAGIEENWTRFAASRKAWTGWQ